MDYFAALEPYGRVSAHGVSLTSHYEIVLGKICFLVEADSVSSLDGKVKVWSVEQRTCVATHSETDKALWSVKWLPKVDRTERFATAGSNHSIAFYREATGG
jgi:WD40 repeat protein